MQVSAKTKVEAATTNLRRRDQGSTFDKVMIGAFMVMGITGIGTMSYKGYQSYIRELEKLGFVAHTAKEPGEASTVTYKDGTKVIINRITTVTYEYTNDLSRASLPDYPVFTRYEIEVMKPGSPTLNLRAGSLDYNCVLAELEGSSTNLPSFIRTEIKQ
jgi:hypothetical protein